MKIDFKILPKLQKNDQVLADAEAKEWIENLNMDSPCDLDETSVEAFFTAIVETIIPHRTVLEASLVAGITRWARSEQAHSVADWVMAHPVEGLPLLPMFARQGTTEALLQLQMIAYSRSDKDLVLAAWKMLEEVASLRGMRVWELQDTIVPTCGMSFDEPWPIDFGAQRFGIRLDSDLAVVLVSESRRILRALPDPIVGDDAIKVAAAQRKFARVLADLEDTLPTQMLRFEHALVEQLRWNALHWLHAVLRHPVLVHLAQRLLWGVYTQGGRCVGSFRVADDNSLNDSQDEPFQLIEELWVGILHPLDVGDEERQAWGVVLADYELPTLFPQIDRPVFHCARELQKVSSIEREVHRDAQWCRTHLISRGWEATEQGWNYDFYRRFRTADILVKLGCREEDGKLVEATADFHRFLGHPQHKFLLRDVPKVVFSEVCLELEALINSNG